MKKIPISNNKEVIVDSYMYNELSKHKWSDMKGYAVRKVQVRRGGKIISSHNEYLHHRVIGKPKGDLVVDHKNCDTYDNRKRNLRICTVGENNRNRKLRADNKTGYKGVTLFKESREPRWIAGIRVNRKKIHLGLFRSAEEAHKAYCAAARKYHKNYAKKN